MAEEYRLQRHSAYFKGWCQAFGEHKSVAGDGGVYWLYGEEQVGLLLPGVKRVESGLSISLASDQVWIGDFNSPLSTREAGAALVEIRTMLESTTPTNIYMTSHFMYGSGPKIITFSNKRPLSIIYKEVGTIQVRLV